MVFLNDKKFACESCIKGHRSSSCHHTERPLFEVKKKGRPVSQCEACRSLRQSKRLHSKCTCKTNETVVDKVAIPSSSSDKKPRRFIPIVPALPNGLRDALQAPSESVLSNSKQTVDSLLNPCHCKSVWNCNCRKAPNNSASATAMVGDEGRSYGSLATLAHVAALSSEGQLSISHTPSATLHCDKHLAPCESSARTSISHNMPIYKHHKARSAPAPVHFDLPPILQHDSQVHGDMPQFATIPPISALESIAGTNCTCGLYCACPGCVEHRGREHADKESRDCTEGCDSCVDNSGSPELPLGNSSSRSSVIDQFFARAATLPLPPSNRKVGVQIDPMNVTVYPSILFTGDAKEVDARGAPFGLVQVPKLECCGGNCGCPTGQCGCGKSCDGCEHHALGHHEDDHHPHSHPRSHRQLPRTSETMPFSTWDRSTLTSIQAAGNFGRNCHAPTSMTL